jgi:Uri superfamily endonuclease
MGKKRMLFNHAVVHIADEGVWMILSQSSRHAESKEHRGSMMNREVVVYGMYIYLGSSEQAWRLEEKLKRRIQGSGKGHKTHFP